jgi:hemolysin activation/secretion protein
MQHTTVGLSGVNGKDLGKANINVVEIGGLYWYHATDKELPTWILARPQIRAGAGLAQNEPVYATARVDVEVWQAYRQGFGSFVALHGGLASQATPVFEAVSFGGSDWVRGFRNDDAIGRRAWAVQTEARIPLPFHSPAASGQQLSLSSLLSQLKLAPLFDLGGAYQTIGSLPGMRTGAGLGLRVKVSFVEFGLDWAYATSGEAATGGSRGKFYFAVKTILPY